jgi:ribosomal-protein-alanine N-acetyltransferase
MNLVFESERLLFKPPEASDLDLVVEQWTDPDVIRYVGGKTYTREELEEDMPIIVRRCAGGCIGIWTLVDKLTKEKIGTAILLPMPIELDDTDWDLVVGEQIPEGDIEIGYVLKKDEWGKGYATEACRRLLKFAFEESPLEEIVASIDTKNTASRNVLEKSGLSDVGLIQAYGELSPGFRITRQEWLERS